MCSIKFISIVSPMEQRKQSESWKSRNVDKALNWVKTQTPL